MSHQSEIACAHIRIGVLEKRVIEEQTRADSLADVLVKIDHYSLVIESAVRSADPANQPAVLAALLDARDILQKDAQASGTPSPGPSISEKTNGSRD